MTDTAAGGKDSLSIATLVLGVFAVLMFFIGGFAADLWPAGMIAGAVATVLGFAARRKAPGDRYANIGMVLGALVVVFGLTWIVLAALGVVSDT